MLVESNRAPVADDVGRQANDGAPEHAPAHRGEAFVSFEMDVERHARQQAMTGFDQHPAGGHVHDGHLNAAAKASRFDAVFSS